MSLYYIPGILDTGTDFGVIQTITVTSTDHGSLAGLGDDDHTQYALIATAETITAAWTFDLDPAAPFLVTAGSAKVANLDADLLDGKNESVFAEIAAIETISAVWTHSAQIAASGAPDIGASGARFGTGFFTALNTSGAATIGGNLDHDGSNIGFFGVAPAARAAAYTPTNVTTDRSYDADTVLVAELADVVGTLIADLQTYGLLQ